MVFYGILLLFGLAVAVPHPDMKAFRSSLDAEGPSGSKSVNFTEAPNVNNTWIQSKDLLPVAVSFHKDKVQAAKTREDPGFISLMKSIDVVLLCPKFLGHTSDYSDTTLPFVHEDGIIPMLVVLTDNKTYFVSAKPGSETDATVLVISKLVNPLSAEADLAIRKKLEELDIDYTPIVEVTKEECLKP